MCTLIFFCGLHPCISTCVALPTKKNKKANAQGRRCSGTADVSPHKKRLGLFFSQSNAHAQGNGPQNSGFPTTRRPHLRSTERQIRHRMISNNDHAANDPCSDIGEVDRDPDKTCTCRPLPPYQLRQLQFLSTDTTERLLGFVRCTEKHPIIVP